MLLGLSGLDWRRFRFVVSMLVAASVCLAGAFAADGASAATVTYSGHESETTDNFGGISTWDMEFSWTATATGSLDQLQNGEADYSLTASGTITTDNTGRGTSCSAEISGPGSGNVPLGGAPLSSIFSFGSSFAAAADLGAVQSDLTAAVISHSGPGPPDCGMVDVNGSLLDFSSLSPAQQAQLAAASKPETSERLEDGLTSQSFDFGPVTSSPTASDSDGTWMLDIASTISVPLTYVALGDSFSTGLVPPYVPGGGAPCYRSRVSYPLLYDPNALFVACSGATTQIMETKQLGPGVLSGNTKIVSLTAGGNNFGIFGLLTRCLTHLWFRAHCQQEIDRAVGGPHGLSKVRNDVGELLKYIHARAMNARIYVLGYPNPMPAKVPRVCPELTAFGLGFREGLEISVLRRVDAVLMHNVLDQLNMYIEQASRQNDATYVPPFTGHDVCEGPHESYFYSLLSTVNGITVLHPNAYGVVQMAADLKRYADPPPS
jgi:hypothetical protein